MLKKISISLALCALVAVGMIAWLQSMIPGTEERAALKQSSAADIPYLQNAIKADRGRILAVVTSTDTMDESGKSTGSHPTSRTSSKLSLSILLPSPFASENI